MRTPHSRLLLVLATMLLAMPLGVGHASAAGPQTGSVATPPTQPTSGPGGSDYSHAGIRVTQGGQGNDAYYIFEPVTPQPVSAPLVILTHGYESYSGYEMHRALIEHTVRQGNVVIYPRWQTGIAIPCPGPFYIEPCMNSEVQGIRGALNFLRTHPGHVRPQLDKASYFGFSFGGIITANLTNRWRALGMPRPRVIFLDDPHDGGYVGAGEPALDRSLRGIPSDALFECHSGADGVIHENGKHNSSCNTVFPRVTSIPAANKNLVLSYTDRHGAPALSSAHGVSTASSRPGSTGSVDAYDYYFIWKVFDALRDTAFHGTNREYALGNTPQHRYMGTWSDGRPVTPIKIQQTAPIRP